MKITYDEKADALYITLDDRTKIIESEELRPDLIIDKAGNGAILGIEILGVSKGLPTDSLKSISFQVA